MTVDRAVEEGVGEGVGRLAAWGGGGGGGVKGRVCRCKDMLRGV